MKQSVACFVALAALLGGALLAQDRDITGTWQGTLHTGKDLRVVIRVSKADTGGLKAVMYSIDQGAQGFPASVTLQGTTVKIAVPGIGDTYEGKLTNSEATSITGSWNQGVPRPLSLTRATPETAWAIPDAPPPPKPMQADAAPEFEVATIKPSQYPGLSLKLSPGGLFEASGPTLSFLIKFAYDLQARQIVGGPSWLDTEKYDVVGKPDKPGRPSLPQLKAMIRKLLADRFQLTVHHEKRELPVYAITIAKSGPKLVENDNDPNGVWDGGISPRSLGYKNMTMAELANALQQAGTIVDRPVVDQTGLGSTRYDFAMKWTPDAPQSQPGGAEHPTDNAAGAPPELFTAFQEQLGLKLESTKALVDVMVIDKVEKPSEN